MSGGSVDALAKEFQVAVASVPLRMLDGIMGKIYVLEKDRKGVESGSAPPEPLGSTSTPEIAS